MTTKIKASNIDNGAVTADKLHTTAITDKLGYTPVSPTTLSSSGLATETYVNTQISNLIASAPTALNTLDELAAALGDDANYAATITTALGTKANTSSLGPLATVSPTGTANSSTFLRGDNSWQTVSVTPTAVSDQSNNSTGYFDLPSGTTAQRPGSANSGMIRHNSTTGYAEYYDGTNWQSIVSGYGVDYLIVAGGGGGGGRAGAGGGAGGYLSANYSVLSGAPYSVVVGAGGAGGPSDQYGGSGANSSLFGITSTGGGGAPGGNNYQNGLSGGSGAGGAYGGTGGSGTAGQGNAGGSSHQSNYNNGGGGGANASGESGTSSYIGSGGAGKQWLNGSYYAGGGGGGGHTPNPNQGYGGVGGGGNGGVYTTWDNGYPGSANTGGGGGGATSQGAGSNSGGAGGSGIVIIRYAGSQKGSGGTITSSGGYTYHTFTTSGTFTA